MSTPLATQPELLQCKCCLESVNPSHQFCPICNFPLKASEEEQNDFIYQRGYKQMELNDLKTKSGKAATTFYVLAGVILLSGLIVFFKDADQDISIYIITIYGAMSVVFILFGIWSNKKPIPAIICGLSLYALITILDFIAEPVSIARGIIFRIFIFAGLIRALTSALEAEKIRKAHKI